MAIDYYIDILSETGQRMAQVKNFLALRFSRVANDIGQCEVVFPRSDEPYLRIDSRLVLYRSYGAGFGAATRTVWFIRRIEKQTDATGLETTHVTAYCANHLLKRRVVAYADGTAQTNKTGYADDVMKAIVRENFGAGAGSLRPISTAYFAVDADNGVGMNHGPTITKEFAWQPVFDVLKDIGDSSMAAGSPVYFDVVATQGGLLTFRTFLEYIGINRSPKDNSLGKGLTRFVASHKRANVGESTYISDWSEAANTAYALAQGYGNTKIWLSGGLAYSDAAPFRRYEVAEDVGQTTNLLGLSDAINRILSAHRQKDTFELSLIPSPNNVFGRDWDWGDQITVEYNGEVFDAPIVAVDVSYDKGIETIKATLRTTTT